MSRIKKAASIPLITHDPFFSIWSPADHLYDKDVEHWCGVSQKISGYLIIDGKKYVFLGKRGFFEYIPQISIDVTATATEYVFENELVQFTCRFTSPLLLDDMLLVSRPCAYIDFEVVKKQAKEVEVGFQVTADLVRQTKDAVIGFDGMYKSFQYAQMGRAVQTPLAGSGDDVAIDWGYAYVACEEMNARLSYDAVYEWIQLELPMNNKQKAGFILAYDDLLSMNYFGHWRRAYWTEVYDTILNAIAAAFEDKEEVLKRAEALDCDIEQRALEIGGESYVFLCNMSYRQTIAAHKLITDEKRNIIFLSKENDSNGCVGTTDVTYPSLPLFLLYNTEYVKGMLRPIFRFAACDVWEFDFAPHDVGRYPYAWGQVYACKNKYGNRTLERKLWNDGFSGVFPPFYSYPAGSDIYDIKYQMPVEECGNVLIIMAMISIMDGTAEFARQYWDVLRQWKNYLVEYGADPGDQLCTDDFAGRLSHNVNLSVKAIMGIEAYAILAEMIGEDAERDTYHKLAKKMASEWEERAFAKDHYSLVFGAPDTWSLKYNLVWDKIWESRLFSEIVCQRELAYYISNTKTYGTPLDSRSNCAKSDWILWCAALTEDQEQREKLIEPVASYLENSMSRVAFGDLYDASTGAYNRFMARSVQGGIFMPMLAKKIKNKQ